MCPMPEAVREGVDRDGQRFSVGTFPAKQFHLAVAFDGAKRSTSRRRASALYL
jgi:hypothetical protein